MKSIILFLGVLFHTMAVPAFLPALPEPTSAEVICSPEQNYKVIQALGSGAFGKVFEVENSQGLHFAIKSYHTGRASDSFIYNDALREYQIGQMLDHPNIIRSIEIFNDAVEEDKFYLVLELVHGKILGSQEKNTFTRQEGIDLSLQLVHALQYAAHQGVIHIDLHNANVMIRDDHIVKVVDLASFVSWQEMKDLMAEYNQETQSEAGQVAVTLAEKGSVAKGLQPPINAKLAKFMAGVAGLKAVVKSSGMMQAKGGSEEAFINAYYLEFITERCLDIIKSCQAERQQKMELYAAIKKVAWGCREDLAEGLNFPLEYYLDELSSAIESLDGQRDYQEMRAIGGVSENSQVA